MDAEKGYHWFEGASVDALTEALVTAGPGARLEVRQRGEAMKLRVVPATAEVAAFDGPDDPGDINDSHRCPPQCP